MRKTWFIFVLAFVMLAVSMPITGAAGLQKAAAMKEDEAYAMSEEKGGKIQALKPEEEPETEGISAPETEWISIRETERASETEAERVIGRKEIKSEESGSEAAGDTNMETEKSKVQKETFGTEAKEEGTETAGEARKLTFKIEGEAAAGIYYGVHDFEDIGCGGGVREFFTDTYEADLGKTKDGRLWIYVQAYGDNTEYMGVDEPEDVSHNILRSMEGIGGFEFFAFDTSALKKEGETVLFRFGEKASPNMMARAAGAFNTTSTKKLTGLTFNYTGSQPTMYQKKPATGESAVWGNGTWTIKRPTVEQLCSLFGVSKPKGARYTNVGVDGSGNIYMRCTGVTSLSDISGADGGHSGLGNSEAYIRCINIETTDSSMVYTFRLWAANGGRGQTTEGYIQFSTYTPGPADISFEKSIKNAGSVRDILGCSTTAGRAGANFRVYKVNSAGLDRIAARLNTASKSDSEWWSGITSKADCKKILPEVVKLMSKDNAKPEEQSPNPNGDYFNIVGAYTTGADGRTEEIPVKSGTKDYYMVFERRSPEGLNMGYDGVDGIPDGAHYFYKAFTVYGDGKILMLNAKGDYSLDGGDDMVTIGDAPLLINIRVRKTLAGPAPASVGLAWKDFGFQISDNAGFTGNVASVSLTGEYTTIPKLFVGKVYYLRENPGALAVTSKLGYKVSPTVYSFYVTEEGKAVYSNTNKANINAPDAVDAVGHAYVGEETQGIRNELDTGEGKIVKVSALPAISDNNPCYSLEGAVYKLYRKVSPVAPNTGGTEAATLITKADGISNTVTLPAGYYYAVETEAPKGFLKNKEPIPVVIERGKLTTISAKDMPGNDPVKIFLRKDDSETNVNNPQGGAALEGAEYTIRYYTGYHTKEELSGKKTLEAARSWVYETDANGYISISDMTPIRGDAVYRDRWDNVVIPVGTVSIQETKAPDGYLRDETLYVQQIHLGENNEAVIATNTKIVKEEPCRGDFKMLKIGDDGKTLSDVPFRITSRTTGESHVIVTDENGMLDTSKTHSRNTNRGESAEDGIWFGELDVLDDEKGALLYDTYLIEEILCENNKDKFMVEPFEVVIEKDSVIKDIGIKENETKEEPKLKTTAVDKETQGHSAFANETTTITDTVEYANLEIGKEYTFKGCLVVKETGKPLLDADGNKITASRTITAEPAEEEFIPTIGSSADSRYACGSVELSFTFDSRLLKGKSVVVFEDLYLEKFHVGAHVDIDDGGQTVRFFDPKISTAASDKNTGKHYAPLEDKVTIVDEVTYQDLIPGHTYKLRGVLMNKDTEQPLLVDGERVEADVTFTPEKQEGSVNLFYTLDSRQLEDVTIVVFETLYYKDREIASHTDIQDENQEIYFTDVKFKTVLTDKESEGHEGIVNKTAILTDTVLYTGLIPGREYTVIGTLMDTGTGKPLLVNGIKAEKMVKFTPTDREGSVYVTFAFDSAAWGGKSVTAFETMYQNGKEVGIHADINDEEQTVRFSKPDIRTMAMDKETKSREAFVNETTIIVDTVHYKNLIPGKEYRLLGMLVDKETGREVFAGTSAVTAETVFTAKAAEGDTDVEFVFDSSALKGKETVVFETLYFGEREIASHKDLQDKGQTISFADIQIKTSAADKASGTRSAIPSKQAAVTDTVEYSGLIPGRCYTVRGILMDKTAGKPLKIDEKEVTASKSFRAEKESGIVQVEFTFDALDLGGKSVVAFEELYYQDRLIVSHADLDDEKQTVSITKSEEKAARESSVSPKTGDAANVVLYIGFLAVAAALTAWALLKGKVK